MRNRTCPKCYSCDVETRFLFPRENFDDRECTCVECGWCWDEIVTVSEEA